MTTSIREIYNDTGLVGPVQLRTSAIDVLRAAVSALSWVSSCECLPVHLMRIKACCARLGLEESVTELLAVLDLMREVQHLGAGYWVPTPTRAIQLPGCTLIVSANTTRELERLLGLSLDLGGVGRIVPVDKSVTIAEEPADDWVGSPADLRQWTLDVLQVARTNLKQTVHPYERVEVFAPWRSPRVSIQRKWWCSIGDLDPNVTQELLLCRTAGPAGRHWFFAQINAARITAEYPITTQHLRLLYGLNLIHDVRPAYAIVARDLAYEMVLTLKIPEEERRVLLAVGREREVSGGTMYEFAPRFRSSVEFALRRIGFIAR